MIGFLRTRVHKQPIIALYFETETVLKFYNLKARSEAAEPGSPLLASRTFYLNLNKNEKYHPSSLKIETVPIDNGGKLV